MDMSPELVKADSLLYDLVNNNESQGSVVANTQPQEAPREPLIIEKLKKNRQERRQRNRFSKGAGLRSQDFDINLEIKATDKKRAKYNIEQWNDESDNSDGF